MNTKKLVFLGTSLIVLAVMLFFAQSAMANTPPEVCGESFITVGDGIIIKKAVYCEKDTVWKWVIKKLADKANLVLAIDQPFVVNYDVIATAEETGEFRINGRIVVRNDSKDPEQTVEVLEVIDEFVELDCTFPVILEPGEKLICNYSGKFDYAVESNKAEVKLAGFDSPLVVIAPIDWSKATGGEIDECIDVTDSMVGPLGTVCAGDQKVFTFEYTREFKYDVCGKYSEENVAKFVTTDTKTEGTSKWIIDVDVPCEGGCTLTPGYWKTHSIFGPAPYDSTWDAKDGGNAEFLGTGKSYYEVLWTDPKGGNAFFILAHAFIAAELNQLNGAHVPAEVETAMSAAQEMLVKYQDSMEIPKKSPDRATAIQLAGILDAYNNGLIGPGHCSE